MQESSGRTVVLSWWSISPRRPRGVRSSTFPKPPSLHLAPSLVAEARRQTYWPRKSKILALIDTRGTYDETRRGINTVLSSRVTNY